VLGSDFVVIEPDNKWEDYPSQVVFQLDSKKPFFCGPMTRFNVTGSFKKRATRASAWTTMAATDAADVMLMWNWFEFLIKEIAVYRGNYKICTSNEAVQIWPLLNAYLYANMEPMTKKVMCPHPENPAYCVPTKNTTWNFDSDEWKKYGTLVFAQEAINFDFKPIGVFPFSQNADYIVGGSYPSALPMNSMEKLDVRITFRKDVECIFKKADAASTVEYKFDIDSIQLCVEEARLAPSYEKTLGSKNSTVAFAGTSRIMMAETISANVMTYRTKFQKILAPEGVFIFALPKEVIGGEWKFESLTDGKIFKPHNLKSVALTFKGETYENKEPNISQIEDNFIEVKTLISHLSHPPFGVPQNPDLVTLSLLKSGGSNSIFPHVYINLCNSLDKTRLVPYNQDGGLLLTEGDLDIQMKFNRGGATDNVTYIIYIFYTDINLMYDMKNKRFSSPYIH